MEWSRDDRGPIAASPDGRLRQYVDADGSIVLEWDDARREDAGDFTVTASNEWGSCTATATLLVEIREDVTDSKTCPTS